MPNIAIDGSNVLRGRAGLGFGRGAARRMSPALLGRLVTGLLTDGHQVRVFFDHSLIHVAQDHGVLDQFQLLCKALEAAGCGPDWAPVADIPIQLWCQRHEAGLVNESDNLTSWTYRPHPMYRVRLKGWTNGGAVYLYTDNNTTTFAKYDAYEPFLLGGYEFQVSSGGEVYTSLQPDPFRPARQTTGVLLVLLLDASGSMESQKTFDSKKKSDHLNDLLFSLVTDLTSSAIANSLYLAILRFNQLVIPYDLPGATVCSVHHWANAMSAKPDYLAGTELGSHRTDLSQALLEARRVILDVVTEDEGTVADEWSASVVLVTDGCHNVSDALNGDLRPLDIVADAARHLLQEADSLAPRTLSLGCVAIGSDADLDLLESIASEPTPRQLQMARVAGLHKHLINRKLLLHVNEDDQGYPATIRTFIDVSSSTT